MTCFIASRYSLKAQNLLDSLERLVDHRQHAFRWCAEARRSDEGALCVVEAAPESHELAPHLTSRPFQHVSNTFPTRFHDKLGFQLRESSPALERRRLPASSNASLDQKSSKWIRITILNHFEETKRWKINEKKHCQTPFSSYRCPEDGRISCDKPQEGLRLQDLILNVTTPARNVSKTIKNL